jgi:hypothetical protein
MPEKVTDPVNETTSTAEKAKAMVLPASVGGGGVVALLFLMFQMGMIPNQAEIAERERQDAERARVESIALAGQFKDFTNELAVMKLDITNELGSMSQTMKRIEAGQSNFIDKRDFRVWVSEMRASNPNLNLPPLP